jgi:hypothetical protein
MLAFDLPVGGLPVSLAEGGEPLNLVELALRARNADEFPIIGSLNLEEWLSDHGFAEHRVDDIRLDGPFMRSLRSLSIFRVRESPHRRERPAHVHSKTRSPTCSPRLERRRSVLRKEAS